MYPATAGPSTLKTVEKLLNIVIAKYYHIQLNYIRPILLKRDSYVFLYCKLTVRFIPVDQLDQICKIKVNHDFLTPYLVNAIDYDFA